MTHYRGAGMVATGLCSTQSEQLCLTQKKPSFRMEEGAGHSPFCYVSNMGQMTEVPINISTQTWPPGSPRIPQSLPVLRYDWQTPPSTLNSTTQSLGYPSSRGFSVYNSDILVTQPFCTCGLLAAAPGSLSPLSLLPSPPPLLT